MFLNKKSVENLDLNGKKVILRCDLNVPINNGKITNDKRIKESLKTINYIIDKGASLIIISHLGRPKGFDEKFSLKPVSKRLSELLNKNVLMSKDVIGEDSVEKAKNLKNGEILLLENIRFCEGETKNDEQLSKKLASLGDVFVNDAFGSSHRAHCSTVGITNYLDSAYGFLIKKELEFLGKEIDNPKRPFIAILGGSKVSDKINVIRNLLNKVDTLIISGAMAYTFLKAQGYNTGNSLVENDKLELAKQLLSEAKEKKVNFILPVDFLAASEFKNECDIIRTKDQNIDSGYMGLDIGEKSIELFKSYIKDAKTVLWNGPLGVFEFKNFEKGTKEIAKALADCDCTSIIGGGDSASAIEQFGLAEKITHISTGGGASLLFLEGKELPGISCINEK